MGGIFTVIANLASGLNDLRFNMKVGIFGILLCIMHTIGAFYMMAKGFMDPSTGQLVLEFSLGTMVLIVIGLVLTTGSRRKSNDKCNIDTSKSVNKDEV